MDLKPLTSNNQILSANGINPSEIKKQSDLCEVLKVPHSHHAGLIAEVLSVDSECGLSTNEAARRLKRDGKNEIKQNDGSPWWKILLGQFSSIIVWLLVVAALISGLTDGLIEASAILVVLILNALIGFSIEWRAGRALNALRRETRTVARVRRDGGDQLIDAAELVVGDIISLTAGDRVPADSRLIEAVSLRADESSFTGESVPAEKSVEPVNFASMLADRTSMLYLGTMVVSGRALGIVTATGSDTELGRIGQLISKTQTEQTPLERRLADLGKLLVYMVIGIALVVMLAGLWRGDGFLLMLEVSISLAVAAVPEGLPAMTTLILALGVLRMARRHAIVRRLSAVETLGSTTVICTDKTGTLTENRMAVEEYRLTDKQIISLPQSSENQLLKNENFLKLLRVSLLCNEAALNSSKNGNAVIGDPTETALLTAAQNLGLNIQKEKECYQILHELPFNAAAKRMITVMRQTQNDKCLAAMKGAPGVVLEACSHFIDEAGKTLPLDNEVRREFLLINDEMAGRALRVLAFAEKPLIDSSIKDIRKNRKDIIESGYTFLGFAGMSDPPREGVAEAISEAQAAGIRLIMLTGDQLMTARSIARKLKLSGDKEIFALNSADISDVKGEKLARLITWTQVFARVSPEDKLRIVESLQQTGEIVAVTGDGINDAPALERADIGIVMGLRGTEVAKEAADVVLADDNFSTIIKAIEDGRTIYANIIKFVHFLFASNLAEVMFIFSAILLGLPLPLLPLQILWINLVTDVFPAFALAVEPARPETMQHAPRPPDKSLLSGRFLFLIGWQGAILALIALGAYLWALDTYGEGAHARTVALLAVVSLQLGHLFNCRSRTRSAFWGFFRNPYVFMSASAVIFLQFLSVDFPPLRFVLDTVKPNLGDWIVILLCTILPILIIELIKFLLPNKKSGDFSGEFLDREIQNPGE